MDRTKSHSGSAVRRSWPLSLTLIVATGPTLALATIIVADAAAQVTSAPVLKEKAKKKDSESPWLLVPTVSASPKLGTSLGGMGAYMHYFDPESQPSLFGASAQYTSTESVVASVFAKTSFDADHHRLAALVAAGVIKNNYDDFLGTGMPLKSDDQLRFFAVRYQYRIWGDLFVGGQALTTNYEILGATPLDDEVLQTLGLTKLTAGGLGLTLNLDSRDNEYSPHHGWLVKVNNIAYRDWIAGQENYDTYRADVRYYWGHGKDDRNVLALRESNQWTVDAPPGAYAPIVLRGYKFGEYLGQYMSSLEAEERVYLATRWTATAFAGIACLYGGDLTCTDEASLFPNVGAGVQYIIKEKEGMVLNLEYAKGKGDNQGIYLKFGYGI